jgi:cobalt-zinc-cadmium efflux system protein
MANRMGVSHTDHGHSHRHDHGYAHSHGHGNTHGHQHHAPTDFGPRFAIGAVLNTAFVAGEAVFGLYSHSLALLADAGHNLGDVMALVLAFGASRLMKRAPTARYTYGFGSSSMLAALFNAATLLLVTGAIAGESIHRLLAPQPVAGGTVMVIAAIGILVNGATALMFMSGRNDDLHVRSAFQHMLADALVAAGVVAAGGLILLTGWRAIDPIVSLVVSAIIIRATWGTLKESFEMMMHAVPPGIDPEAVRAYLQRQPGVEALHDLHIWPTSTTDTALTVHLVMPNGHPGDLVLSELCHELTHRFKIGHATFQVETGAVACTLEPAHTI